MNNLNEIEISALKDAIAIAGSQRMLAQMLTDAGYRSQKQSQTLKQQTVAGWVKNGLPPEWAVPIEAVTGVSRTKLAANIFLAVA